MSFLGVSPGTSDNKMGPGVSRRRHLQKALLPDIWEFQLSHPAFHPHIQALSCVLNLTDKCIADIAFKCPALTSPSFIYCHIASIWRVDAAYNARVLLHCPATISQYSTQIALYWKPGGIMRLLCPVKWNTHAHLLWIYALNLGEGQFLPSTSRLTCQ